MTPERTWKIGDPGADSVCNKNVRLMDQIADRSEKRCGNPDCRFPIPSNSELNFSAPGFGELCTTCRDLWTALSYTNTRLRNSNYFRAHHDAWLKDEQAKAQYKKDQRRRMGLDYLDE